MLHAQDLIWLLQDLAQLDDVMHSNEQRIKGLREEITQIQESKPRLKEEKTRLQRQIAVAQRLFAKDYLCNHSQEILENLRYLKSLEASKWPRSKEGSHELFIGPLRLNVTLHGGNPIQRSRRSSGFTPMYYRVAVFAFEGQKLFGMKEGLPYRSVNASKALAIEASKGVLKTLQDKAAASVASDEVSV